MTKTQQAVISSVLADKDCYVPDFERLFPGTLVVPTLRCEGKVFQLHHIDGQYFLSDTDGVVRVAPRDEINMHVVFICPTCERPMWVTDSE